MNNRSPSRKSIRLPQYNYSSEGHYFVTICTHERENLFGEIIDGKMTLNDLGKIIREEWISLARYYHSRVLLDIFVIMPNHFHAVIILNPSTENIVGATLAVARDVINRVNIVQKCQTFYRAGTLQSGGR